MKRLKVDVAIIPARRGSKSIINKNLQRVGSRSLIDRAVESAKNAGFFKKIIITTDIPSVIEDYQADREVGIRTRPKALCTDDAVMSDVVRDVLDHFGVLNDSIVWLLQPTSPFRSSIDYVFIQRILSEEDTAAVISVKDVGADHPSRMYTIKEGILWPLRFVNFDNKQKLPKIYERNGCFYVARVGAFREHHTFYLKTCRPYLMEPERSINIDTPFDLRVAQMIAREMAS